MFQMEGLLPKDKTFKCGSYPPSYISVQYNTLIRVSLLKGTLSTVCK